MSENHRIAIANKYGDVDLTRTTLNRCYVHVPGKRLQPLCRKSPQGAPPRSSDRTAGPIPKPIARARDYLASCCDLQANALETSSFLKELLKMSHSNMYSRNQDLEPVQGLPVPLRLLCTELPETIQTAEAPLREMLRLHAALP